MCFPRFTPTSGSRSAAAAAAAARLIGNGRRQFADREEFDGNVVKSAIKAAILKAMA
jgi:hypothetical protein